MKKQQISKQLDQQYDKGYFHGVGSGYGKAGYEKEHEDWTPLLKLVKTYFTKTPLWLDVGCAYGFLLQQALHVGIPAFGTDISSYALRWQKSVRNQLVQSLAEQLPFHKKSVDVVSLFDILEHVPHPEQVIDEVSRVLKPEGLLFLSTPDPIYFDRKESTHVHERPPSYWVDLLQRKGYKVQLRFGDPMYTIEMIATRKPHENWVKLCSDYLKQRFGFVDKMAVEHEDLHCIPRRMGIEDELNDETALYVLNASKQPLRMLFFIQSTEEHRPDVYLGDLKLRYEGMSHEGETYLHQWRAVHVPPGGRFVTFRSSGEALNVQRFIIKAHDIDRDQFLKELPFDHYQRYQLIVDILKEMDARNISVLDVGGAYGYLPLFLPDYDVTVADVTWEDHPCAVGYDGNVLPYENQSFDLVLSVDTLEHIPAAHRKSFLDDLTRVSRDMVIVCGPFDEPHVADAEMVLREFITTQLKSSDRFLDEHQMFTLPKREETLEGLQDNGFTTVELPNGYLPRWLSMQLAGFALGIAPELIEGKHKLNTLYNSHYYTMDNRHPAYRIVMVSRREGLSHSFKQILKNLVSSREKEPTSVIWNIASLIVSLSHFSLLQEKEKHLQTQGERIDNLLDHSNQLQRANEKQDVYVARLLDHLNNLENAISNERSERSKLHEHTENLDQIIQSQTQYLQSLQAHCDHLLIEQKKELQSDLAKHVNNLVLHYKDTENLIHRMQEHATHLQHLLSEQQKHSHNLQEILNQKEAHYEQALNEQRAHSKNLESLLTSTHTHSKNLEVLLKDKDLQLAKETQRLQKIRTAVEEIINQLRSYETLDSVPSNEEEHLEMKLRVVLDYLRNLDHEWLRIQRVAGLDHNPSRIQSSRILRDQIVQWLDEQEKHKTQLEGICRSPAYRLLAYLGWIPKPEDITEE